MNDDFIRLPEAVMDDVKNLLRHMITTDPEKAINYLKTDPLSVIALPGVRKELLKTPNGTSEEFFEQFDSLLNQLFIPYKIIDEWGLPLTIELVAEKWREYNQKQNFSAFTDILLKILHHGESLLLNYDNLSQQKIIRGMVEENINRISNTRSFEQKQNIEAMEILSDSLSSLTSQAIEKYLETYNEESFGKIEALLKLATMGDVFADIFRKEYSKILLNQLKLSFNDFDEKDKYKIAPFLLLIDKDKELSGKQNES